MDDSKEQLAEQVLVLRCQSGDEFAFTRMMRVYDSRLRYYVRRLMASRAEADDLMQEIWLAVWRHAADAVSSAILDWTRIQAHCQSLVSMSHALADTLCDQSSRNWSYSR